MRERINSIVISELAEGPGSPGLHTKVNNQIELELGYYLQVQHLADPNLDLTSPYV